MFIYAIVLLCVAASFAEPPPQGSELCKEVLQRDCTGFEDEVVCGSNGVTYHNSCEFAKGLCNTHGHSLHAVHNGPC